MENTLIAIHNILRWMVLLSALYAITKSVRGLMFNRPFTSQENRSHAIFVASCHLQLLLGIILYFIGPRVQAALQNGMGEAMKNSESRFWAVEHIIGMITGILIIQIGRIVSKKAANDASKHRKAIIYFSIGLLIILLTIPWKYSPLIRL
jgi:hypothetical protein